MPTDAFTERKNLSLEQLAQLLGTTLGVSDWILIDQTMIDGFAATTGDDAYIHVDPARAAKSQFHGTIAHGLLTLSLLPLMLRTATPRLTGTRMGVNYGFDRVRFISPVAVNSRLRGRFVLAEITQPKPQFSRVAYDVSIEIEGSDVPAATARWLLGHWMT